jgi:hypothetical protein
MEGLRGSINGHEYSHFDKLIALRSEYWSSHIPVPKSLNEEIDRAYEEAKAQQKQGEQQRDDDEKSLKADEEGSARLIKEVRAELGLPPLPDAK